MFSKPQIACFQFTSNRIQMIASLEILRANRNKFNKLNYFYLGNSVLYPSKMAQHSFNFFGPSKPKYLKPLIKDLDFGEFELGTRLIYNKEEFTRSVRELSSQLSRLTSISELSELKYNEIAPGAALANVLAFEYQSQDLNLQGKEKVVNLLLKSYLQVYFHTKLFLQENLCGLVLLYNGRFLHERAVWDACVNMNVDVSIYETTRDRYHIRNNVGFHNRVLNQELMIAHWNKSLLPLHEKVRLGSLYFDILESGRNSHFTSGDSFVPPSGDYFVFFTNSDDEAVGFWDSWSNNGLSQVEVVKFLSEYSASKGTNLVVRLHPNLKTKPIIEQEKWDFLRKTSKVTLVDQFSNASSYEIMKRSSGVISFGSTIGLEAAYNAIPSLVLADCWYDILGAVDKVEALPNILNWIESLPLSPDSLEKRKNASLIRGFWLETAGENFRDSMMFESTWGAWDVIEYRGRQIKPKKFYDLLHIGMNRVARWGYGLPNR